MSKKLVPSKFVVLSTLFAAWLSVHLVSRLFALYHATWSGSGFSWFSTNTALQQGLSAADSSQHYLLLRIDSFGKSCQIAFGDSGFRSGLHRHAI